MQPRVYIDAGHGGLAAVGRSSPLGVRGPRGTLEKDVTLAVAERVAARLGARAALTRRGDVNLSLGARVAMARGADALISLHCNSGPPGARGTEIYVHPHAGAGSRALGETLRRQVARLGHRGHLQRGELALLQPGPQRAACLIELDYLTDPEGEDRLRNQAALDDLGEAIARGVAVHLDDGRFGTPIGLFGYYQPDPDEPDG